MKALAVLFLVFALLLAGCTASTPPQPSVAGTTPTPQATSQPSYAASSTPQATPTYPSPGLQFSIDGVRTQWVSGNGYGYVFGAFITFKNNGAAVEPLFDIKVYRVDGTEPVLKFSNTMACAQCNSVAYGGEFKGELPLKASGNLLTSQGNYQIVIGVKNVPAGNYGASVSSNYDFTVPQGGE